MTDQQLIQQYVQNGDEAAFRQLVSLHINLVYSCAKRQVRDAHLAEDVTQVVFMILARKAATVASDAALPGWLFKTTRFVAADVLVAASRRKKHEREAAQMLEASQIQDSGWEELEPYLDEGLAQLGRHERDAVLLRYFQGLSLRETGVALGIPENTAAKRISRAIERLRTYFAEQGIRLAAPAIITGITTHGVEAAPASLAAAISTGALAAAVEAAAVGELGALADHAIRSMAWARKVKIALWLAGASLAGGAILMICLQLAAPRIAALSPAVTQPAAIANGWPLALPGNIAGTPAMADLDGDGKFEIVVATMHRSGDHLTHPNPTTAAMLFAFRADGAPVKGWPVVLLDERGRAAERARLPGYADNWAASPSVADLDGDGRDEIIITAQPGRTFIINGDGSRRLSPKGLAGGEVWSSFPIADVNGDGKLDLIGPNIAITADGNPIPLWAPSQPMNKCFAPCVGDSNGDGQMEVYYCAYRRDDGMVHGLDHTGKVIPGWPQFVTDQCAFPPVMGDVNGDGKMEIFVTDNGGHLMGWTWNGRPLLPIVAADGLTGIFKGGIIAHSASPTLADLDGDGRPEIIVFDQGTRSIKAWRGDGRGLFADDGTIVQLPDVHGSGAVTVGDLGGDGVMDLFVGTYWVQLAKDGKTSVIHMVSQPEPTDGGCLITDVDHDGKAEIVFGLANGEVVIYRTGMDYNESWMQWPTPNGNQRHTGVWRRRAAE